LGLSKVTLHTLRHTCASLLISSGASITSVSRILGHSSVVQTLNTYSHYYKEDVEVSMAKLGDLYSRGLAA
jgi:integrase